MFAKFLLKVGKVNLIKLRKFEQVESVKNSLEGFKKAGKVKKGWRRFEKRLRRMEKRLRKFLTRLRRFKR